MEFEYCSFSSLSFSTFAVLLMIFLITRKSKKPKNLPPGPWKLPLIGHLHLLAGSAPTHHTLRDLAQKHGPLMHLQLGEVGYVIVSSPEMAKHLLRTHDLLFASRPSLLATEIGCYGNADITFAPYGKFWRQLRRICQLELLSVGRVKSFQPIRAEEVLELCKWIAQQESSPINLSQELQKTNYDIMGRAVLGKKTDEKATYIFLVKEGLSLVSGFDIVDLYPSVKILRLVSGMKKKIEKHHRRMDRITGNIIEERKRENAAKKGDDGGDDDDNDLLNVLLGLQADGSLEIPLTTDNIKAVLEDLFGAGVETASSAVEWAMAEMLKNPQVLHKAQEEVRNVFDVKNHHVDESYFNELKYLKLVIKESLRVHTPGPLLLPRECRERCEINGYEIPKGTRVLVNAWAVSRDPKHWDDPESFKPERFVEKPIDFMGGSMEFIPFGAGRRICPGIAFGMATVEMALAMLLYYFDWILPDGMKPEDLDMSEAAGVAGRKRHDLRVVPLLRRPFPLHQI